MTPEQQKVLDDAVKRNPELKKPLTGGSKYINPIRKRKKEKTAPAKKTSPK
jgi:hypothetical protein